MFMEYPSQFTFTMPKEKNKIQRNCYAQVFKKIKYICDTTMPDRLYSS